MFISYAITLLKPTRSFEDSNLFSPQSTKKTINKEPRHVVSKSWENLRNQLEENSKTPLFNILYKKTLGNRLSQRNKRSVLTLKPTNSRSGQLLTCKLQHYNLAILNDGTVHGVKNQSNPYVLLDLQKYDGGFGTIQHPKNKRYIAMNSNGTIYSTTTFSEEVLFNYLTGHYPYIQFSSHKYKNNGKDMLIGLRADGQIKKGKKTSLTHKSTKFLIVGTI